MGNFAFIQNGCINSKNVYSNTDIKSKSNYYNNQRIALELLSENKKPQKVTSYYKR